MAVRQSAGGRLRNSGSRLRPCISDDAGSWATSRNVGAKSTFSAIASLRVRGAMPAGQRTTNGMRIDSSYMKRLSNIP